ncbi:winged helix-turn-helix transcriptional regulator [Pseudonocardia eucalypti]|uniref:Winged helix-turn-helix transcriptional regulator n=1 Tax=Pseudonocardia eucalypti TaxID=648755 RepID=A0ABP9QJW3_9PSEU
MTTTGAIYTGSVPAVPDASSSAIGRALLILGDQWALRILQRAFLTRTRRFADWRDQLGMSESVLAGRIRELVTAELLVPAPYREGGRTRHEYRLTPQAVELWSMLVAIWAWEREWVEHPADPPDLLHNRCGACVVPQFGCWSCGRAPVTARETRTTRTGEETFASVAAAPRLHRRTVRADTAYDRLSYYPETLEILGDRWSTVVLAAAFLGVRRFVDFQAELGAAPSVLAQRLRRFGELGVLGAPEDGSRGDYRLTTKGMAFFPVLSFLVHWAQRWYGAGQPAALTIWHQECGAVLAPMFRCPSCHLPVLRDEITFKIP